MSPFLLVVLVASTVSSALAASPGYPSVPLPLPENVLTWTVADVASWAEDTLLYPDLSRSLRDNAVDGITLLALRPDIVEQGLNINNPIHAVKLMAHIRVLRGQCLCASYYTADMWSFYYEYRDTVWPVVMGTMWGPRVTMLWVGKARLSAQPPTKDQVAAVGHAAYAVSRGKENFTEDEGSLISSLAYWMGFLIWPHIYFAFLSLRWYGTNYFVVFLYLVCQGTTQYSEWQMLLDLLQGPVTIREAAMWLGLPAAVTVGFWLASFIIPHILMDLLLFIWFSFQTFQVLTVLLHNAAILYQRLRSPAPPSKH